ncbi:hypothetical protein ACFYZB_38485 [Streptomyces sp. NPDC001852]
MSTPVAAPAQPATQLAAFLRTAGRLHRVDTGRSGAVQDEQDAGNSG